MYYPASFRRALNRGIRQLIEGGFIERTETMIILAEEGRGIPEARIGLLQRLPGCCVTYQ